MLSGTVPELMLHVSAGDDTEFCVHCALRKDASGFCDNCAGCEDCQLEKLHCYECGDCLFNFDIDFCDKDGQNVCMPCLHQEGLHCIDCHKCYCDDQDAICQGCFRCVDCCDTEDYPGGICLECGMCAECSPICPECDQCGTTEMCPLGEKHCKDFCCDLCPPV